MKTTVYLYWVSTSYDKNGGHYEFCRSDTMDGYQSFGDRWKFLCSTEVEFDVPAFDARAELIESIKKEKAGVIREATKKAEQLEEKIQQLLALDAPAAA